MDKYYQLLDRDPATISPLWKAGHILCFIVIIISGFIAAYALGKTEEYFGNNCILFASITFLNTNADPSPGELASLLRLRDNSVRPFNMSHTQWGSTELCSFCQFTPLCSTIFGFVWCALFIIFSRGGAGYMTDEIYRPWRLVYPAMIYTFLSTAIMSVSLLKLSAGIKHFCAQFEPIFETISCNHGIDIYTQSFSSYQRPLTTAIQIGLSATYICFFAGLIHLCIILFRILCIVDFQMIRISVSSVLDKGQVFSEFEDPSFDGSYSERRTMASVFAFPVNSSEKDDFSITRSVPTTSSVYLPPSSTTTVVPIAQSESLSDVLSSSPRNKPRDTESVGSSNDRDSPTKNGQTDKAVNGN